MPSSPPELVAAAKELRPAAVAKLLENEYPAVYRLAYALAGRWDVGRGVARFVLARSVRFMPKWDEDDPANWYHRFTIMTARRSAKHQPTVAKNDVLVEQALEPDAAYVAFISALRHLDTQQREAFLLYYCERLNARYSALAMDCSTAAAETHLRAADDALRLVAGEQFAPLTNKLRDAYQHLTPDPADMLPAVNRVVFRQVKLRRWVHWLIVLIELAVLAGLLWGGWKLYHLVRT